MQLFPQPVFSLPPTRDPTTCRRKSLKATPLLCMLSSRVDIRFDDSTTSNFMGRLRVSNCQFWRSFPDWTTLHRARSLAYADLRMKDFLLVLLNLAVMTAKLCGPGGVRAVIAENLVLKQQLIVLRRGRRRAPNLTQSDRLLCGFARSS